MRPKKGERHNVSKGRGDFGVDGRLGKQMEHRTELKSGSVASRIYAVLIRIDSLRLSSCQCKKILSLKKKTFILNFFSKMVDKAVSGQNIIGIYIYRADGFYLTYMNKIIY